VRWLPKNLGWFSFNWGAASHINPRHLVESRSIEGFLAMSRFKRDLNSFESVSTESVYFAFLVRFDFFFYINSIRTALAALCIFHQFSITNSLQLSFLLFALNFLIFVLVFGKSCEFSIFVNFATHCTTLHHLQSPPTEGVGRDHPVCFFFFLSSSSTSSSFLIF
jgi:hypothetical protein